MAVLNSEVGSIMAVQACAGARLVEAISQHTSEYSLPNGNSKESEADVMNGDNQRSSGRSRTPTQRLAESNLRDSTRLIFLSGEGSCSASPSPTNDQGDARRGLRRGGAFSRSEGGRIPAPEEGREKRRRDVGAQSEETATSRPKRAAAAIGEAKREICMEKLLVRRSGQSGASGKPPSQEGVSLRSSSRHANSQTRPAAARRPARDIVRRRDGTFASQSKAVNGRSVRKLPVVKSGSGSKTRLDLPSSSVTPAASSGKRTHSSTGKSVARGEDGDDMSTGSSEQGSTHRRDWGLMEVDAVGRNRPPFARTMLYHGTVPFALPADLNEQARARNWVIKRWPDKTNRRKIDQEVHECIKAHPHPYLVRILDVSPSEGVLMDYWNEGDLHKHMTTARRKFMPVKEIARYMIQLLRGLAHLHKHKVVHCDVSPQNVFLRRDREREEQLKEEARVEGQDTCARAKTVCYSCALGDFGHSYILSQHEESRSGVAHQGAEFVAPEVKDGRVSTMASDIFSAGKILEELLNLSESFGEAFEKEPKFMVRKLRGLANLMCSPSPSERPTALRSCQKLDTLGESIN